jgi:hypothetical protein
MTTLTRSGVKVNDSSHCDLMGWPRVLITFCNTLLTEPLNFYIKQEKVQKFIVCVCFTFQHDSSIQL